MTSDITIIKTDEQKAGEKGVDVCLKEEHVRDQAKNARDLFSNLQLELDEIEDNLRDGLSYLDMKNDTLLSYMIDLCNIVLRKVRGEAISGHPSVERSVYYRVILEKIKTIDQRLAYQLNKVITMPDTAEESGEHGVNLKNLDIDLGSEDEEEHADDDDQAIKARATARGADESDTGEQDDEEEEEDDEEEDVSVNSDDSGDKTTDADEEDVDETKPSGSSKKPIGVYKPPKLRSVAYNDGKGGTTRRRRDFSDFYQDDDDNQDIVEESRVRVDLDRARYEEENYTRLPDANSKKAKRKLREKAKSNRNKKVKGSRRRR